MQREVKFEAESTDRLGNLIGWITLPSEVKVIAPKTGGGKKKSGPSMSSNNLSVVLVAKGYATVNRAPNTQRASQFGALIKAEEFARQHNLGLWSSEEFRATWNAEQNVDDGENTHGDDGDAATKGLMSVNELRKALPTSINTDANKKANATRLVS